MLDNKAVTNQRDADLREDEFIEQVKKRLSFPFSYGNITITLQAGVPVLVTFEHKRKV
jgi:hypothetical protein